MLSRAGPFPVRCRIARCRTAWHAMGLLCLDVSTPWHSAASSYYWLFVANLFFFCSLYPLTKKRLYPKCCSLLTLRTDLCYFSSSSGIETPMSLLTNWTENRPNGKRLLA